MAIFKCKMCGGELNIFEDSNVCECEYCGTTQTVPTADDEKKMNLFNRANRLRANNEFDKAAGVYESIVAEFPEEAEAYWGLVLCKYGIEYVDDPATNKKVPTCHRSSFDSISDDSNFEMVMEYADSVARGVYRSEAKQIEEIRKGIIEVSSKEEPYDIFICYKETAENGDRTVDSLIAQDTYDALTEKGYRVFFSRITLEDKLGQEYEPYIFAALNSAKVMLAFGTDYEYYNAVWVKNEWSRYLQLIAKGEKKTLIPCYKDIDPFDMPKEFAKLQAQDMGKVGALQDLLRGIEKIIPIANSNNSNVVEVANNVANTGNLVEPLLKRAVMFLEDSNWSEADTYCEKVLDIDPENGVAYLYKLMAQMKVSSKKSLVNCRTSFGNSPIYKKVLRFCDETTKKEIEAICADNKKFIIYTEAKDKSREASKQMSIDGYFNAAKMFDSVSDFRDAASLAEECRKKGNTLKLQADENKNRKVYNQAKKIIEKASDLGEIKKAINMLKSISTYLDSEELIKTSEEAFKSKQERYVELTSRCDSLYEEAFDGNGKDIELLRKQIKSIESIKEIAPSLCDELSDVLNRKKEKEENIAALRKERNELGLFDGKKKKELDSAIYSIDRELDTLKSREKEITEKLEGYTSVSEIDTKLSAKKEYLQTVSELTANDMISFLKKDTKNSRKYVQEILEAKKNNLKVGDYINFGVYGGPISWKILAKENGRLLLLSENIIDYRQFHTVNLFVSWPVSDIRTWLNSNFIDKVFTPEERKLIDKAQGTIYLLNFDEMAKFFKTPEAAVAKPTEYALRKAKQAGHDECRGWWLRGKASTAGIEYISSSGTLNGSLYTLSGIGQPADEPLGVRPAMWITI